MRLTGAEPHCRTVAAREPETSASGVPHRCKLTAVMGLQSHPRLPMLRRNIPVDDRLDDNGDIAKRSATPWARTMPNARMPWRAWLGTTVRPEPIGIRLDPPTRGLVMRREAQQTRAMETRRLLRCLASCAGWRSNSCRRNPNETRSRRYRAIFARLPDIERRA